MNQIERIKPAGVVLKEVLQDNERHAVFLVEQEGELRIYKMANGEEFAENIALTVKHYLYMSALCDQNPNSLFRPRRLYAFNLDEGWFIGENFNMAPLFTKQAVEDHGQAAELVATYLVPFLYEASTYTAKLYADVSLYREDNDDPVKRPANRLRELSAWALTDTQEGLLATSQASETLEFIRENIGEIKTGIELRDLETWEMFVLGDGKLGLIDLEYLDTAGKRHFDAVWQFFKLWTVQRSPHAARMLLCEYRRLIVREPGAERALMVMLAMKFLGVLYDAANLQLIQNVAIEEERLATAAALELVPLFKTLTLDALS